MSTQEEASATRSQLRFRNYTPKDEELKKGKTGVSQRVSPNFSLSSTQVR